MQFLIRTEADLLVLLRRQSLFHPFRKPPSLLDIPEFSADENAVWSQRLEYFRQQCGCTAAVIGIGAFLLATLVYVLAEALQPNLPSGTGHQEVLFGSVSFSLGLILSTLLGKLVGLTFAARRFRRTCRAIQTRLRVFQAPLT